MGPFYWSQYRIHQAFLSQRRKDFSSEHAVNWTVNEHEIKVSEDIWDKRLEIKANTVICFRPQKQRGERSLIQRATWINMITQSHIDAGEWVLILDTFW